MQVGSLLLAALLGILIATPLPLMASLVALRRRLSRAALASAVIGAGIVSGLACTTWLLSTVEDTGQHALGPGFSRFAYGIGFPLCQLVAVLLILIPTLMLRGRARQSMR